MQLLAQAAVIPTRGWWFPQLRPDPHWRIVWMRMAILLEETRMTTPERLEREVTDQSTADSDSLLNKVAREVYVFGGGTVGGALKEAHSDVMNNPAQAALKVAESIGVGAAFAAAEFAPAPIKLGARVLGTGLMVHFFSDLADKGRWQGLSNVWSDTWNSGNSTNENFAKVQGSLGRLALESGVMFAGAKLGGAGIGKAIDFKFGAERATSIDIQAGKASPQEVASLVVKGGLPEMISHDASAWNVARSAAIEKGGLFAKTTPANEAAIGSKAYGAGEQGNAYTAFLRDKFGTLSDMGLGLPVTEATGAAAANPHVMKLPVWQRKGAVEAVTKYATEVARGNNPHGDASVLNAEIGKIAPTLLAAEVRTATDAYLLTGGRINAADIQSAARVHTATIGNEGFAAWRVARDAFAGIKTGNPSEAAALAERLVPELTSVGFRHEQLIRPDIMKVAAESFLKDPALLPAAAISARILPRATTTETVSAIKSMLDAGWNGNAITRTNLKPALELAKTST
jgi:hypothetical protein